MTVSAGISLNKNRTIEAIIAGAKSGAIGDGKILVLDLSDCIRIRTGEVGMAVVG